MGKSSVAIISTSINAAPLAYTQWAKLGDLIVAGDRNSPDPLQSYVEGHCHGRFLHHEFQDFLPGSFYIGWNTIQRRNAALWAALRDESYKYILTVDDDNLPMSGDFINGHKTQIGFRAETTIGSRSGFLNTGALCQPRFHQRGTPYGVNTDPYVNRTWNVEGAGPEVVVSQAQVMGSPDCDAVERICNNPHIVAVSADAIITPGVYAAFNSQATMWRRDWAPVSAVLPGVGRYDDILASFIFHRLARAYHVALYVGTPTVKQIRNDHNLTSDLKNELFGMNIIFEFAAALNTAHISNDMKLYDAYGELITAVAHLLPSDTVKFAQAWTRAWREML